MQNSYFATFSLTLSPTHLSAIFLPATITLESTAKLIIYALKINWHEWCSLSNVDLCVSTWSIQIFKMCGGGFFSAKIMKRKEGEGEWNGFHWLSAVVVVLSSFYVVFVWHCKRHRCHNDDHYYYIKCDGMSPIRSHKSSKSNAAIWRACVLKKRAHSPLTN